MKALSIIIIGFGFLTSPVGAHDSVTAPWVKTNFEDGVEIYEREIPGSDVLAFKGHGIVKAPIAKVATVIFDTKRAPEWVSDLEKASIIESRTPYDYIEYDHVGTPFVMKDRDFVSRIQISWSELEKTMTFKYSPAGKKKGPKTNYVRGRLDFTTFKLKEIEGGKWTLLSAEIHVDPMGSVPKWIVNMFQKSWPLNTMNALRRQVQKPDLVIEPRFERIKRRLATVK